LRPRLPDEAAVIFSRFTNALLGGGLLFFVICTSRSSRPDLAPPRNGVLSLESVPFLPFSSEWFAALWGFLGPRFHIFMVRTPPPERIALVRPVLFSLFSLSR